MFRSSDAFRVREGGVARVEMPEQTAIPETLAALRYLLRSRSILTLTPALFGAVVAVAAVVAAAALRRLVRPAVAAAVALAS
jgi:hypothetical protein